MATNIESADALIKACDKNNVKLFVVKQNSPKFSYYATP